MTSSMHPFTASALARAYQEQRLRDAEQWRLAAQASRHRRPRVHLAGLFGRLRPRARRAAVASDPQPNPS